MRADDHITITISIYIACGSDRISIIRNGLIGILKYRCRCSYEVAEAIDEELAFIDQGEAFVLNQSAEGLLLVMGRDLHVTQLIEVHASHSRWGRTANVYEVRWIKPILVESFGNLYLVGCRWIFGPYHYLSF